MFIARFRGVRTRTARQLSWLGTLFLLAACGGGDAPFAATPRRDGAVTAPPLTFVTIDFDDATDSQLRIVDDLADATRGFIPATFFVNSDRVGSAGFLSWADLAALARAGHEIAGHDLGHLNLVGRSFEDDAQLVCDDRAALVAAGFAVGAFAFPFGGNDATAEAAVATCMDSARDIGGIGAPGGTCTGCPWAETLPPRDLFAVRTTSSFSDCPSAAEMAGFVDRAVAAGGGWLPLVFHRIAASDAECGPYQVARADFAALLDRLRALERAGLVRLVTHRDVVGFANPSFERQSASGASDCWERVVYRDNSGSFTRVDVGHSGGAAEQLEITRLDSGNRKLLADRARGECLPRAQPGHAYRLSAWYQYAAYDGGAAKVRFVVYYKDVTTGRWVYFQESPSFAASSQWARMTWDTAPLPAEATLVTAGVLLQSVGKLTVDDLLMSDLGP